MADEVLHAAVGYLSRREYSRQELMQKLQAKGYEQERILTCLERLSREGLQSDERFTEAFVISRLQKGQGPMRIRVELRQRGVADSMIATHLDERAHCWYERAREVRQRKYADDQPSDYREKMKQARFLQQRGFTSDQIQYALGDDAEAC